jgi:anti-anti-sigma factor
MEIRQEQRGGISVLVPVGRLDTDSSSDLELALQDLRAAGSKHFVIDMDEIGYVSSAGLRVLLMLAKQLEGGKGSMRISGLNPQVKQVFDIAGFTKLFAIFPTLPAALDQHPNASDTSPALGSLASKIIGAAQSNSSPDADDAKMARAAAGLLGVKPKAAPKPVPQPGKNPNSGGAKTMALASLKTPVVAPPAAKAATPEPEGKPGFFARLFSIFRRR